MHFARKLLAPFLFKGGITSSSNSELAKLALIEKLYNLNAYDISHEGDTISFKNHLWRNHNNSPISFISGGSFEFRNSQNGFLVQYEVYLSRASILCFLIPPVGIFIDGPFRSPEGRFLLTEGLFIFVLWAGTISPKIRFRRLLKSIFNTPTKD